MGDSIFGAPEGASSVETFNTEEGRGGQSVAGIEAQRLEEKSIVFSSGLSAS